jgi:hypothetical protein
MMMMMMMVMVMVMVMVMMMMMMVMVISADHSLIGGTSHGHCIPRTGCQRRPGGCDCRERAVVGNFGSHFQGLEWEH